MTEPLLIVLNFSGGRQSTCILHMVLRGDLEVDLSRFIVLNADPGMEATATYEHVALLFERCRAQGIYCQTVEGPDLYRDLLSLEGRKRLDSPPYWTKNPDGTRGRLMQKCTRFYKVAPMDRHIRQQLQERYGISKKTKSIPHGIVEKWIGFSYDEVMRIKPPRRKYITFRYPLIERRMGHREVTEYYAKIGEVPPPRSVCNACFANGRDRFHMMRENDPKGWAQALAVDAAVRTGLPGVNNPTYVSQTLLPLQELVDSPKQGELFDDSDGWSCDSGYCFT